MLESCLLGVFFWQVLVEVKDVVDGAQVSPVRGLWSGWLTRAYQDVQDGLDGQDHNQSQEIAQEDAEVVPA